MTYPPLELGQAYYKGRVITKTLTGYELDGVEYESLSDATDVIDWA